MNINLRGRGLWVLIASAAGLTLAAGIAYAAIPDSAGVIHVCFKPADTTKPGGASLAVIDSESGGSCKGGETELRFNQQGPPGPPGPPGPAGPAGPPGLSGVEVVSVTATADPRSIGFLATALCPTGKLATGGGVDFLGLAQGGVHVSDTNAQVDANDRPIGWFAKVHNESESFRNFRVRAICASVAP